MKHFRAIVDYHRFRRLPKPEHPLISVINLESIKYLNNEEPTNLLFDFYCIAVKKIDNFKVKYGQQEYDFDEGILSFMRCNQLFGLVQDTEKEMKQSGWMILIHPDFFWNSTLATTIKQYDFWDYSVNEALFLSKKEEIIIYNLIQQILGEYSSNMDQFSKKIIISHLETLLNYGERFYHRQFITREKANHQILDRLEKLINGYFLENDLSAKGLPTVQYVSETLNISPNYLRGLLKGLIGLNTQQYIHEKLI